MNIKDKLKAAAIYGGVIFIAIATVFFGVSGKDQMGDPGAHAVARVNGEPITQREFSQKMEEVRYEYKARLGAQYDERFLEMFGVSAQTLDQLVKYELLAQYANEEGFRVADNELRDYIHSLPYLQKDGKFSLEMYNNLRDRAAFQDEQRKRLLVSHFQQYAAERVRLPAEEVRRSYILRDTKIDLEYARIDLKELAKKTKPSPADLEAFIKTNPEAELKAYYDKNKKEFTENASNQIRQIRVGIPFQASAAQKEEAKKKVDSIAKEVNAANFAQVAKTRSDDEYAKKGGDAGWIEHGGLEPTLEAAIDKLTPGQISSPIETPYGFYVIQLLKRKESTTKSFELVKRTIAEKVLAEKHMVTKADEMKKAWNALLKDGKSLDAELKKAGVEVKKTGPFSVGQGQIPNVGSQDALLDAMFTLTKKAPTVKELVPHMDQFYFLRLKSVEPAKLTDFAKNSEVADRTATSSLQGEVLNDWVTSLEKQAKIEKPQPKAPVAPGLPGAEG